MDTAEFVVDTDDWKTFYKMKYKGKKNSLLAFSALVNGTIQEKMPELFPELESAVSELESEELEAVAKKFEKLAKKAVRKAGIEKDYKKYAQMWAAAEFLKRAGLTLSPTKRQFKGIMKKKI